MTAVGHPAVDGVLRSMTPIDQCMQTLGILVRAGKLEGLASAEKAVDHLLEAHAGPDLKLRALQILSGRVNRLPASASSERQGLLKAVSLHIKKRWRSLDGGQ